MKEGIESRIENAYLSGVDHVDFKVNISSATIRTVASKVSGRFATKFKVIISDEFVTVYFRPPHDSVIFEKEFRRLLKRFDYLITKEDVIRVLNKVIQEK